MTGAYVDLMFAFGHARLGDVAGARALMDAAWNRLDRHQPVAGLSNPIQPSTDPVHFFLLRTLCYRIEEAIRSNEHAGDIPSELRAGFELIEQTNRSWQQASHFCYGVERFRSKFRIADPYPNSDPYGPWKRTSLILEQLTTTSDLDSSELLSSIIRDQLSSVGGDDKTLDRFEFLKLALRRGRYIAVPLQMELLNLVDRYFEDFLRTQRHEKWELAPFGSMFYLAMQFAAFHKRTEWIRSFVNRVVDLIHRDISSDARDLILSFLHPCVQKLCALDMQSDLANLLECVLTEESEPELRLTGKWPLEGSLALAMGAFFQRRLDVGQRIVNGVWTQFIDSETNLTIQGRPRMTAEFVATFLRSHTWCPIQVAMPAIENCLTKAPKVQCIFITQSHFSELHLQIGESAVLAMATDDFSSSLQIRQRLGPVECRRRVEFLPRLREMIYRWGEADWHASPKQRR
jgi:hypothetical protein